MVVKGPAEQSALAALDEGDRQTRGPTEHERPERHRDPPELTDGRLRLRALRADDKATVVAALNDELVGRFLYQPPFPYEDSDFDEWFTARATAGRGARRELGIARADDDA